jgi:fumarate reductase subunit C
VIACAIHVPIGVTKIAQEWASLSSAMARRISWFLTALILIMGFAAVWGVS